MTKREYNRRYYQANRERLQTYQREYGIRNREKVQAQKLKRYHARPPMEKLERSRRHWLASRYKITTADYDSLLRAQGDGCAICGESDPRTRAGRFNVDHDHETGKVRGLLCGTCNRGLGMFGDSADLMLRGAEYLCDHAGAWTSWAAA